MEQQDEKIGDTSPYADQDRNRDRRHRPEDRPQHLEQADQGDDEAFIQS